MKIVNRETFFSMPAGTVFAKYEPCVFGHVTIKGQTCEHDGRCFDYFEQPILDVEADSSFEACDVLVDAERTGKRFGLSFDCQSRDGMFEADQLFAVFEPHDVEALIERLKRALRDSQEKP